MARYRYRYYKSFWWRRRNRRWQLSRVRSVTDIIWFCVYAWMYLKLRNKYKTFINVLLIFTKSCIPSLLLNNRNVFLPFFCLLSVKVEDFKHMWGNTARFLCFFQKKLFFAFEKLFVSMTWKFWNKFGQFDKWYRSYKLYWISWKVHFLFCEKKIPAWNLRCFEVVILISWNLTLSHDINIRIRTLFSLDPLNHASKMPRT